MPLVWMYNGAAASDIPFRDLAVGFAPDIVLACLGLAGLFVAYAAPGWTPHYLIGSGAVSGGVWLSLGSLAAHGVLLSVGLLVVAGAWLRLRAGSGARAVSRE